jgi:hypothetical protein
MNTNLFKNVYLPDNKKGNSGGNLWKNSNAVTALTPPDSFFSLSTTRCTIAENTYKKVTQMLEMVLYCIDVEVFYIPSLMNCEYPTMEI